MSTPIETFSLHFFTEGQMPCEARLSAIAWGLVLLFFSSLIPIASAKDGTHLLGIVGYNYTSKTIGNFNVGGAGGGMVSVSNERSGGGGIECCIRWRDGTALPQAFRVRWDADRCAFTTPPNMYGETFETIHHIYKEAEVELSGPVPEDPENLEVHFYPDGHIELAITMGTYTPRLKLDAKRKLPTRRCTPEDLKP